MKSIWPSRTARPWKNMADFLELACSTRKKEIPALLAFSLRGTNVTQKGLKRPPKGPQKALKDPKRALLPSLAFLTYFAGKSPPPLLKKSNPEIKILHYMR